MDVHNPEALERLRSQKEIWQTQPPAPSSESGAQSQTVSGIPLEPVYTPEHVQDLDYNRDLGAPGDFPFTRGVHPTMYRGRLWTRRQIAGFGTAKSTNARYRYLLAHGQTGLSTDFDHPTLTGYDSDHPLAEGEVGRLGVAIDTVNDMDALFQDIPLDQVSVSLTINHPSIALLSMLIACAQERGTPLDRLRGTVQNDSLKEFYGQKTFALPPRPAFNLSIDIIEYCTRHVSGWNSISISGYHTREAGANAIQELAFTLAAGMAYVEGAQQRGMSVDEFGPRLSFFFGCHNDFFEEVAKFRAARRMWAKIMRSRFGAKDPRAMRMRFHTQTLGSTLMRQGPRNNIIRGTTQAMAAVLGGTQSLHVSGYDEAFDIPSEEAMRLSLNTQLILASETGIAGTADPLAGSFFVERLTNQLEEAAWSYIEKLDATGDGSILQGVLAGIDSGYFEREIAQASYAYNRRLERWEYVVVGLNGYQEDSAQPLELYQHDPTEEDSQLQSLAQVKRTRDSGRVAAALDQVRLAAGQDLNLMPAILDAAHARATEGEMMGALRDVYGEYRDPGIF